MSKSKKDTIWVIIILLAIIIFHFINNYIWISKNRFLSGGDFGWHLIEAFRFHLEFEKILGSGVPFFSKTGQLIQTFGNWSTPNWPPLIYFLSALINPREVNIFHLQMYLNFIFYILLILSTYFLGKKCFNRKVGLIAAFLSSFYPSVCVFSRQFSLDFPLLGLTAMCLCLLAYSENFSKRGYSLFFGLTLGTATLVKLQVLFFLLGPLLYIVFKMCRDKNSARAHAFLNFILSSIIAFILFYLYWGNYWGDRLTPRFSNFYMHAFSLYPFYTDDIPPVLGQIIPIFSFRNFIFYLQSILFNTSLFPFMLFVCAFTEFLMNKNKWRIFFCLSLLIPYFIFTLLSIKWTRYMLPLSVSVAILTAWWIDSLKWELLKIIILCLVVLYSVSFYLLGSWVPGKNIIPSYKFYEPTSSNSEFLELSLSDRIDYVEILNKNGIVSSINQRVKQGKRIRIEFGNYVSGFVVAFYIYFQNDISHNLIDMRSKMELNFDDPEYIIISNSDLSKNNELLKKYSVLAMIENVFFLKKNEKSSFI